MTDDKQERRVTVSVEIEDSGFLTIHSCSKACEDFESEQLSALFYECMISMCTSYEYKMRICAFVVAFYNTGQNAFTFTDEERSMMDRFSKSVLERAL